MAPHNAAHSLQGHKQRPSVVKPIVPAIPLPYIQKRKQNSVSVKKAEDDKIITPASATQHVATPTAVSPAAAASPPKPSTASAIADSESPEQGTLTPIAPMSISSVDEGTQNIAQIHHQQKTTEGEATIMPRLALTDFQDPAINPSTHPDPSHENILDVKSNLDVVSAISGNENHSEHSQAPAPLAVNGQPAVTQMHPNSGNLVFGGFSESDKSSPAPQSSGAVPLQAPLEVGRAHTNGHVPHNPSAFMPGVPASMIPSPMSYARHDSMDNMVRRHGAPFQYTDNFSPMGTSLDWPPRFPGQEPMTPHSIHGSQSSVLNEQEGHATMYGGPNGFPSQYPDETRYSQPARAKPRTASHGVMKAPYQQSQSSIAVPIVTPGDDLDGLVGYIQSQFNNPTFADYMIELRYTDDRAPPFRLAAHNIIIARSPVLKDLMIAQLPMSGRDHGSLRLLLLESDDRFLRSDAFQMALQRLYGGPMISTTHLSNLGTNNIPGHLSNKFEFALAYVAAGRLLQMPPVMHNGTVSACAQLSMHNLELAFEFALEGGLDETWCLEDDDAGSPTYGPAVSMLLHAALNLVITSFPPNFELNTALPVGTYDHRLPNIPKAEVPKSVSSLDARFSGLRFGDHTFDDSASPPAVADLSTPSATISKILLDLPFPLLKYVLESPRLGNVSGWATAALRQKAMHAIIEEREKRRLKVFEHTAIGNDERRRNRTSWRSVGWKESVGTVGPNDDQSVLVRTWVGNLLDDH